MKTLIRFITKNQAGGVEHTDRIINAEAITLGRATDQLLHIRDRRVRLEHARIETRGSGVHIVTGNIAGVVVNGRSQRDAELDIGDVIEIGANILRIIEPPEGVDFALAFELVEDASREHFVADWSAPTSGIRGFGKRRLSWTLATIVLVFGLLLPALVLINDDVASAVRNTPLPDDSLWLAGPLHAAHSTIDGDCQSCHVTAFERVPDSACVDCHTVDRHVAGIAEPVLGDVRCASCHLEHNEPAELVNRNQALCTSCHTEPPSILDIEPASDFLHAHPSFRVSLVQRVNDEWTTVRMVLANAVDNSNLSFDHAAHLDPDGVNAPDGRVVLDCASCHVPEPGGAGMQPIAMDEHCSSCHTLTFDPDEPDRELPHGNAAEVVQTLIEFYSARLLGDDPDAVQQRVRRPGQALTRADRDRVATEARSKALDIARDLFERQTCANCHTVTRAPGDAEVPWIVEPVRLTNRFLPSANFSHRAHDTDVTQCGSCHTAASSTVATDVLIPNVESCRDCHGSGLASRNASHQLPSTCIMCHGFHSEAKGNYP